MCTRWLHSPRQKEHNRLHFLKRLLCLAREGGKVLHFNSQNIKRKPEKRGMLPYLKSNGHFTFCPEQMTPFAVGPSPSHLLNLHCSLAWGNSHLEMPRLQLPVFRTTSSDCLYFQEQHTVWLCVCVRGWRFIVTLGASRHLSSSSRC